jgi:hypothetical protein
LVDALRRLGQAIQQLGSGQEGKSPVAGGDLMQQVGAMQTYWRAFLQERLEAVLGGAPSGYRADGAAMTDVEQFMVAADDAMPDATLADMDEWMDEPESDVPDTLSVAGQSPRRGSSQEPGDDETDWLSDYLSTSGDDDSLDDLDMLSDI